MLVINASSALRHCVTCWRHMLVKSRWIRSSSGLIALDSCMIYDDGSRRVGALLPVVLMYPAVVLANPSGTTAQGSNP